MQAGNLDLIIILLIGDFMRISNTSITFSCHHILELKQPLDYSHLNKCDPRNIMIPKIEVYEFCQLSGTFS